MRTRWPFKTKKMIKGEDVRIANDSVSLTLIHAALIALLKNMNFIKINAHLYFLFG